MVQRPAGPQKTALYRLYSADEVLLYVGVSLNPRRRWDRHRVDKPWWSEVARRDVEWLGSSHAAHTAETQAIRTERPRYNRTSTDDYRRRQSAIQRANADSQRVKCRVAYEASQIRRKIQHALLGEGMPWDDAIAEGRRAERAYKESSGAFPNGVTYPPA